MPTVEMLKGIPGSGKSTYARRKVAEDDTQKRINKDDIRTMIHAGVWTKKREKAVVAARDALLLAFMNLGYNIIIDDTNVQPTHEPAVQKIVDGWNKRHPDQEPYTLEVKWFHISVEEAIERDSHREGRARVGPDVIRGMYNKFVKNHAEQEA